MRRYLFGPVTKQFAEENLDRVRRAGVCLAFNAAGDMDLTIAPPDTWETVCARLPPDWQPDFIVLYLPYTNIPACLWSAPVPIIGLAADWNLLWHHYRSVLRRCDLVLTDAAGVEAMHREGISQARPAVLYGYGKDWEEDRETKIDDGERDIDILFVGNLHPAVQRERLKWLGRLAVLSDRWNVQIHTGVFGKQYRDLSRRARVVFNRSIRGEANRRVFEAVAAGALLFQEEGNLETPQFFRDRQECVYYNDDNLEDLLDYYLEHEDERRAMADAGQARAAECSFDKLWSQHVTLIEAEWPSLLQAATQRKERRGTENRGSRIEDQNGTTHDSPLTTQQTLLSLFERTWHALSSSHEVETGLTTDLAAELVERPQDAELHNALGLMTALTEKGPGSVTSALTQHLVGYFQRAFENDPHHFMAGLNLVEALVGLDQKDAAVAHAKTLLATIAEVSSRLCDFARESATESCWLNACHFPPAFDLFRVEWEKAAWNHAGDRRGELEAKERLLLSRLHLLLAELTDDLHHYYEAVLVRPDLPNSQAALGCALGRIGHIQASAEHLRFAVAENPFDLEAARALQQVLKAQEAMDQNRRLARDRRRLAKIAPKAVPTEEWFTDAPPVGDELASIVILCCNELEYTQRCLDSVLRHTRQPYELILIDNGSTDGTAQYLEEIRNQPGRERERGREGDKQARINGLKVTRELEEAANHSPLTTHDSLPVRIEVIRNETNLGYPAGCNQGIAQARGRYLVFLNNDTIVTEGWLPGLIGWALHDWPKVGMVSPVTNYSRPPQQIPVNYRELDGLEDFAAERRRRFAGKAVQTERLAGFCTLIRREVLDQIGGFDERYGLGFFDDDDLCVRTRQAGYQLLTGLNVFVHHFGSRTFTGLGVDCRRQLQDNFERFRTKWGPELAAGYRLPESVANSQLPMASKEESANGLAMPVMPLEDSGRTTPAGSITEGLLTTHSRPLTTNHSPLTISLCMIVRNEEQNLPACLESARDLFDEIIIADTGSIDRTREIAGHYGAKVVEFPWVDSFAAARNESMRHATGDYIFWLDADDRLDPEARTKLKELLAGLGGENLAFSMKCLCTSAATPELANGAAHGTAVDHVRLFRNQPGIAWTYRVHEQILPSLRKTGAMVNPANVIIHHVGYQDASVCLRKHERDLRLLQMDHADNPDDPFILFNLGWTFSEVKKPADALPLLHRSLELSQPGDSITRKLFALIVQCQRQLKHPAEAVKVCLAGRQYFPDDAELLFQEALARNEHRDFQGAEKCLLRLIDGTDQALFASVDVGLRSYKARHNLAVIVQAQGRSAEAEAQWRHALNEQPDYVPAVLGLAELYLSQSRVAEVERMIKQLESIPSASVWRLVVHARLDMARRDFPAARRVLEEAIAASPDEIILWIVLSHTLLQEGKDWPAAENALRKILQLDPGNTEAQRNQATLLSHLSSRNGGANGQVRSLAELYNHACQNPSDINEHCPTLFALARQCRHVTEMGTRTGVSTLALLFAQPEKLVCYDLRKCPEVDRLQELAGPTRFIFQQADVLKVEIEETDLLFIDTWHVYEQLKEELRLHAPKVRKYIVLHDTTTYGNRGETEGRRGLWPAIEEFLAQGRYRLHRRYENNNGLTVLQQT